MYETSVHTSSGRIDLKCGTEGPQHDPYSYTETTYSRGMVTAMLHDGLGVYSTVTIGNSAPQRYEGRLIARYAFKDAIGYTPEQLYKFVRRAQSRCSACGCSRLHSERGYPGETFKICDNCGTIVGSSFNRSAVE